MRLGPFEVDRELGRGGSAVVYAVRRTETGPDGPRYALKVPRFDGQEDAADLRRRFLDEGERLARIDHPSVVRVHESGRLDDTQPFILMDLLEGVTLDAHLASAPLAFSEALALFRGVIDGVAHLHDGDLLHRDLKAENVMLVGEGEALRPVLIDLGIAKDTRLGAGETTQRGIVRGTVATMAPERFFGQPASIATDVYELGVLFYFMVARRLPWEDEQRVEQRLAFRPLAEVADVPAGVSDAVALALATHPERRPRDARDLLARIEAGARQTLPSRRTAAIEAAPQAAPTIPPQAKRSWRAPVIAAAVIGVAAVGWAQLGRSPAAHDAPAATAAASTVAAPSASDAAPSDVATQEAPTPDAAPSSAPAPLANASARANAAPAANARATASAAVARKMVPACARWVAYMCEQYGEAMCAETRAAYEKDDVDTMSAGSLKTRTASCEGMLREAVERDEPTRSANRLVVESLPSCMKLREVSCTPAIVDDAATKPFCEQGRVLGTSAALSLPADKADEACATMIKDLPTLVAQRRALKAGDDKAKTDVLQKYGLQNMP